ncbi:MAG: hypothetical protein HN712_18090 [Gemmatimonadetes bacterium]|jgi:anti-sigma factor RsiW|nr:hypothetical protein [Gemmatimonadota bacterium]MBT7862234.1 hypothetical protein [Gemmatimonadota bacterium]
MTPTNDDTRLSAFIDGELADEAREEMAAQIALDPQVRHRLDTLRTVDEMVASALQPPSLPAADHCANVVLASNNHAVAASVDSERPTPRVPTAVLASVGLLVTAGVAFVGLRRRGLV